MSNVVRNRNKPSTNHGALLLLAHGMVGVGLDGLVSPFSEEHPSWAFAFSYGKKPKNPVPNLAKLAVVAEYSSQERDLQRLERAIFIDPMTRAQAEVLATDSPEAYENAFYAELLEEATINWVRRRKEVAVQAVSMAEVSQADIAWPDIGKNVAQGFNPMLPERHGELPLAVKFVDNRGWTREVESHFAA